MSLEVAGISAAIKAYGSEPYINNILKQLENSVNQKNVDEIIYLLKSVSTWYERNQSEIQSNFYVDDKQLHIDIEEKIKKFIIELEQYSIKNTAVLSVDNNYITNKVTKKFFISHSSKDKLVCDAFVKLLENIGIPEEQILYTSSTRHGIPGDHDIFQYIRKHISDGITVFYMLSDNYYDSIYCLNEMGAAWVVQNNFSIFTLPNFTRPIDGVIDSNKKAYSLSDPVSLIHFKNNLNSLLKLNISEARWEEVKNEFLKVVNSANH